MPNVSRLSNPRALGVQCNHRDTKGKVLEVLADSEEITGQRVVEQEVLDLLLDGSGARLGVVLQAAAVAHFDIELLASGKRLIVLNQFEDIIGHHVVAAPWQIGQRLVDDGWHHIDILFEYLARVHLKRRRCVQVGYCLN